MQSYKTRVECINFLWGAIDRILHDVDVAGGTFAAQADGSVRLANSAVSEVQVAAYTNNDVLTLDPADELLNMEVDLIINSLGANNSLHVGLGSAWNNNPAAIANRAMFALTSGALTPTVETDDGTTDSGLLASGITVPTAELLTFRVDLASGVQTISPPSASVGGLGSVEFSVTNSRGYKEKARPSAHLDLSGLTGSLQPVVAVTKQTGTGTASVDVKELRFEFRSR